VVADGQKPGGGAADGRTAHWVFQRRHLTRVNALSSHLRNGASADTITFILIELHSHPVHRRLARQLLHPRAGEHTTMYRFWSTTLLSAALMASIAVAPRVLRAEDQKAASTYHDKQHNDDHQWNGQEDKAYRLYAKQNHRKYSDFSKLKEEDQQNYWNWRHEHSDAVLKIEVK
jgi:hypothetical protein